MWYFKNQYGIICIIPIADGRFTIRFDGENYGSYCSANSAASDVSHFVIGCYDWDKFDCLFDVPEDVSEWTFKRL